MRDEINYTEYQREVYDHERQTGQHVFECDPDESAGFSVKVAEGGACIATYNVQILSPSPTTHYGFTAEEVREITRTDKRVLSNLPAMIESMEEDLSDLLPEGYEARITEWSSE